MVLVSLTSVQFRSVNPVLPSLPILFEILTVRVIPWFPCSFLKVSSRMSSFFASLRVVMDCMGVLFLPFLWFGLTVVVEVG